MFPQSDGARHLSYRFACLSARDALVFKSLLGLLSARTSARWEHTENTTPDLLVLGTDSAHGEGIIRARATLFIGEQPGADPACTVHTPLRAHSVYECLEHITRHVLDNAQSIPEATEQPAYRMIRWPQRAVLQAIPQGIRMATLLGSRFLTAEQLAQRSGSSLDVARQFIHHLRSLGLLEKNQPQTPVQDKVETVNRSFFARLRAHFGLHGRGANQA